jgi:biopolymer transport protein ExbB/TolQ
MFEFFETAFTNPVVIVILIIVGVQMTFSMVRTAISLRQSRQNAEEMERVLQESEARLRDIIRDIENNRRELAESLDRSAQIRQENKENGSPS